ncbi:MAG: DUF4349 domain-containing protein [Clostridia bacterium]|nr:DUF4349 domain-containing protein [Clostridia bacterium]
MDCRTFSLLLDTPEAERTPEQVREMEAHAAECRDCALLLAIQREMRCMDEEEEIPAAFSASWRERIRAEEENKTMSRFPWKKVLAYAAAFVFVAVGTAVSYNNGWGTAGKNANQTAARTTYTNDGAADYGVTSGTYLNSKVAGTSASYEAPMMLADSYASEEMAAEEASGGEREAKIVRTVNFTVRTQQYEQDYDEIRMLVEEYGGRIESLNTSGDGTAYSLRRANYTLRIPSQRLEAFLDAAKGVGNVSNYSESSEDVSENYYDMQSRLETQEAKLQRLNEMLAKAKNISDLIELEEAISDTQYWIDYYTGRMRGYDSRVADSYVYITLREINNADAAEQKELSLGERIVNAVKASLEAAGEMLQAFVIFFIAALPWLIVLAGIVLVIRAVVRSRRKHRKAAEKAE